MGVFDRLSLTGNVPFLDAVWLMAEHEQNPSHVGAVVLLEPPSDAAPGDAWQSALIEAAMADGRARRPFDRRLADPGARFGFSWVSDGTIDVERNVSRRELPAPGGMDELFAAVSELQQQHLERDRPLWQLTFLEGLDDGRLALFWRVSHALIDGSAAIRQLLRSVSLDPDRRDMPALWAPAGTDEDRPGRRGSRRRGDPLATARHAARTGMQLATSAARLTTMTADGLVRLALDRASVSYPAPATPINVPISPQRVVVGRTITLERLREIASVGTVTVNDVVLAGVGGGLRRYLQERDGLPDAAMTALVPVSTRTASSGDDGNMSSMVVTTLATDLDDPVDRLVAVKAAMDRNKRKMSGLSGQELLAFGAMSMTPLITAAVADVAMHLPPIFNVTVSNVPGPRQSLYWNGARLSALYPASLLFDGCAVNVTLTSYDGVLHIGLTADPVAVPDAGGLADEIMASFDELEHAFAASPAA